MRCAAIVFDWAGTMVDFGSCAPVLAMRNAFVEEKVALTDSEIRAGMGLPKRQHLLSVFGHARVAESWRAVHGKDVREDDVDRVFGRLEPLMREAGAQCAHLVPGAAETAATLRAAGIRIASTTGYTRTMMEPILAAAAAQGYAPDFALCAGEVPVGRPSPFMIWRALMEFGVWPASAAVKVDDAPVGIAEGKNAGCFTVGVAASGNSMGLTLEDFKALTETDRRARLAAARTELLSAGADAVIDTVADLPTLLRARGFLA